MELRQFICRSSFIYLSLFMKKYLLFLILSLFFQFLFAQRYLLNDFKPCIAVAKGGLRIQECFNYNCITQSMEFKSGDEILRLEPISQIDTLYLEGHKMIPYGTRFLEVFYQSPAFSLLIDYKRSLKEDGKIGAMGIKTQHGVQNVDHRTLGANYRQEWERGVDVYSYKEKTSYWIKVGRKMRQFRDEKSLVKLFPDKKRLIESYIKEHHIDFSNHCEVLDLLKTCL